MRVGVIPRSRVAWFGRLGIPHASGGDPKVKRINHGVPTVFPMRVGVILRLYPFKAACQRIPHASGGRRRKVVHRQRILLHLLRQ